MAGDLRCGNAAKIEALAAAEHRGRDLVRLGGGQDEAGVGRRLLQRLQQRVERAVAQHVHFVDDVDLVAALAGAKAYLVAQFADVVDAVVRRRVDLDQVDHAPFGDRVAGGTGIAGAFAFRRGAVERLGQDARRTGLAGAAWPGEEIGVRNAVFAQRIAQGLGYMLLAHHLVKGLAAPFAIECGRHQHRPRSGRAPASAGHTPDSALAVYHRNGCAARKYNRPRMWRMWRSFADSCLIRAHPSHPPHPRSIPTRLRPELS
jgi:hypothetical protein